VLRKKLACVPAGNTTSSKIVGVGPPQQFSERWSLEQDVFQLTVLADESVNSTARRRRIRKCIMADSIHGTSEKKKREVEKRRFK
jgi:hypothetical protein